MSYDVERWNAAKAELKRRIGDLVATLAPGGTVKGRYYIPQNPTRNDRSAGSFFIWITGDRAGAWVESQSGEKGDVIDLIKYCMGFPERGAALVWAEDWIGGERVARPVPTKIEAKADDRRTVAEKREAAARWFRSAQPFSGSLGETYMASRGIELDAGQDWPAALRFLPQAKHRYSGRSFPCMIAAYTDPAGEIIATHRTFLAADGSGKAPVEEARLSWPDYQGGVIRLHRGVGAQLVIVEGIEKGMAVVVSDPAYAVWAVGALGNLQNVRLPQAEAVIVWADNDWGKKGAEQQLARGMQAIADQCPDVREARSPIGKDADELLRRAGKGAVRAALLEAKAWRVAA